MDENGEVVALAEPKRKRRKFKTAYLTKCHQLAWESIATDIFVKSFLYCGISNKFNGTEDYHIWDCIPSGIAADKDSDEGDLFADCDEEVDIQGTLTDIDEEDGRNSEEQ